MDANADFKKKGIGTKLVHSGEIEDESFKAAVTPIYRATTYTSDEELYSLIKKHGKTEDPRIEMNDEELKAFRYKIFYARSANPNVAAIQRKMAFLEGCDDAPPLLSTIPFSRPSTLDPSPSLTRQEIWSCTV